MSRDDIETNFIEELGLSDDSDLDPDFVPQSEKDNLCESLRYPGANALKQDKQKKMGKNKL